MKRVTVLILTGCMDPRYLLTQEQLEEYNLIRISRGCLNWMGSFIMDEAEFITHGEQTSPSCFVLLPAEGDALCAAGALLLRYPGAHVLVAHPRNLSRLLAQVAVKYGAASHIVSSGAPKRRNRPARSAGGEQIPLPTEKAIHLIGMVPDGDCATVVESLMACRQAGIDPIWHDGRGVLNTAMRKALAPCCRLNTPFDGKTHTETVIRSLELERKRLIMPSIIGKLRAEWTEARRLAWSQLAANDIDAARLTVFEYQKRLSRATVLDPAAGSANLLFITYWQLKRIEEEVIAVLKDLGVYDWLEVAPEYFVSPKQLYGIEVNPNDMTIPQLREEWQKLMTGLPPASRPSMLQQLVYRVQEIAYGGVSEQTRQKLLAIARNEEYRPATVGGPPVVGTRFTRIWRGERYEVTSVDGGFVWNGQPFTSLTAVAKAITGQHWNGKLFFGLTVRNRK